MSQKGLVSSSLIKYPTQRVVIWTRRWEDWGEMQGTITDEPTGVSRRTPPTLKHTQTHTHSVRFSVQNAWHHHCATWCHIIVIFKIFFINIYLNFLLIIYSFPVSPSQIPVLLFIPRFSVRWTGGYLLITDYIVWVWAQLERKCSLLRRYWVKLLFFFCL